MLSSINLFDAVVCAAALVTALTGFNAGLIRSLAVILGYAAAMPLAVAVTPLFSPAIPGQAASPWAQNSLVFFAVFLIAGIAIGGLLRFAVNDMLGPSVTLPDRLAGSALGIVRVGLVAVALVLVFDRIIPNNRQPTFLRESSLRPLLSNAGQRGLRSLPPELASYIDQLKKDYRI